MSNLDAFLTGFMNKTAEKIDERKAKAEDYYDQQMERARLFGEQGLKERRDRVQAATNLANNLRTNAGVPEHIIRAVANEGLDNLEQLQSVWENAASNGIELDSAYWEQAVPVAQSMRGNTGQPLGDFLKQAGGLYVEKAKAGDKPTPQGSVWDSITGRNGGPNLWQRATGRTAMDDARGRLDETEISGGMSAGDLNRLEARGDDNRVDSNGGFGVDVGYVADMDRAAAAAAKGGKGLSISEISSITSNFQKAVDNEVEKATSQVAGEYPMNSTEYKAAVSRLRDEAEAKVAKQFDELYGGKASSLPFIAERLSTSSSEEAPVEETSDAPASEQAPAGGASNFARQILHPTHGEMTLVGIDQASGAPVYRNAAGKTVKGRTGASSAPTAQEPVMAPEQQAKSGWVQALETITNPEGKTQEELDEAIENYAIPAGEEPPPTITLNGNVYNFKGTDQLGLAVYVLDGEDATSDRALKIPVLK